jgi:AcrR family transcriptional regulator
MMTTREARLRGGKATLPPNATPNGTRRRILEVALQLFASEGYHASSVRDIARVLELQPSALYGHFPSKEHLLAELARVGYDAHAQILKEAVSNAGEDPVNQLRALVRAHTIVHATYPHLAVIVHEEMRALTNDLAAPALALRAQSSAFLFQVIENGITKGCFSPPDRTATAAAIAAMGVRIPYWYDANAGFDLEALAEIHVELSLRMLGAPARSPSL